NPRGLDSQPLVARSLGEGDQLLARAFGTRTPFYLLINKGVPRLMPFEPRIPYESPAAREFFPAGTGQPVMGGVTGDQPWQTAKAGRDKPEVLAFNINYIAIPGNFVMDFDLSISNAPPDQPAVKLDIVIDHGRTTLGLGAFSLTGDMSRVVSLPVHVKQLEVVEPRVFYQGVGDIIFRGFRLREIVSPANP
ncbi:MAG: hypothetical protein NTY53_23415, partial [Kiritimatiellaeota bacterium]|nr:hypothetical protein [Kiritimatiellota bacterium]